MRILLIEDEGPIAEVIALGLEQAGYTIEAADDGRVGLDMAQSGTYALIILDLMLPGMDGWTICKTLREERNATPILMLTARDAVKDRVHGLEIGADDYLPKPFDFSELIARVQALLRRDRMHKTRVIRIADLEIDTRLRRVTRAGQEITLTPREYALLEALAGHEGQVLTRDLILEQVWQDEESLSNTVDVYVGLLRRKLHSGHAEKLIHTVHGVGYTLRAPHPEDTP
ncbi:DNA-binding response regulator [Capsulimonas corticalis]|uniref:DNA-binding response regulator n=1 Tax=Capsulimonas corticalis TaxID=2219043 RepID=A0A402D5G7_9BACT|nr:response regulator transcription factor [Capsulimonas corticalis]BDI29770.1 DNA-binding response regulator [Capsulimonas corticalis]